MTVYGLSQSTGVERLLEVERSDAGIVLRARDSADGKDRETIVVPVDDVIASLTEQPAGGTTIEATSAAYGTPRQLDLEVRGNEVLLQVRPESAGWDVAVGLDDFQDAIEAVADAA